MTADKLALRDVYTPNRPAQEVQGVIRRVASAVNGIRRCVGLEEYADDSAWASTLTATSSATFVDTDEQVRLTVQAGDVLDVSGRLIASVDPAQTAAYQVTVYEGAKTYAKAATLSESSSSANPEGIPFACLHTVIASGTVRVVVQMRSMSGGSVYLLSRGEMLVKVWRGGT